MGKRIERAQAWIDRGVARWNASFFGRMINRFASHSGGTLANGMAYNLLFAFFSGMWTVFSVITLLSIKDNALLDWLTTELKRAVPSLDINPSTIGSISLTMTWTGLITFCLFLWEVLCCLDAWRSAAWMMMDKPKPFFDPFQTRLLDTLAFLGLVLLFIVSSIAGAVSGGAVRRMTALLRKVNILQGNNSLLTDSVLIDCSGFMIGLMLNIALMALMFLFVARIDCDKRIVAFTCAVAGLAISILQLLGSRLLGGATSNPLLAPFAAIIGVLIWFSFIAQIMMYCAAFLAEMQASQAAKSRIKKTDQHKIGSPQ